MIEKIRNYLLTLPPHVASRRSAQLLCDAAEELEQLQAVADAAGNLDGRLIYDHVGKLSEMVVSREKSNALHVAWSEWKAAEAAKGG